MVPLPRLTHKDVLDCLYSSSLSPALAKRALTQKSAKIISKSHLSVLPGVRLFTDSEHSTKKILIMTEHRLKYHQVPRNEMYQNPPVPWKLFLMTNTL